MIRPSIRLVLLVCWLAGFALIVIVASILTLGRRRAIARVGSTLLTWFSAGLCRIFGIRVTSTGTALPAGACLVTPNHWGYVDVFVLGSLYRTLFVSRADVADWPVIGFFARAGGTLFIRREIRRDAARVGDEIETSLWLGSRVTAFLEGGAGDGIRVRPFKSALVEAAVTSRAPCVPVAIRYTLPANPELSPSTTVAWIDGDFTRHLWRLMGTRRIEAGVTFLPPRTGSDRKELARQLEEDVRAALENPR